MPLTLPGLLAAVHHPQTREDLRAYFTPPTDSNRGYTGRRFELLAGGGDRPGAAHVITADDLIAVQLLSVRVPARTALDLLEGPLGQQLHPLLKQVPNTVDLGSPQAADLLAPGKAADRAWQLIKAAPKVGPVTAGELLARKRPLAHPCLRPGGQVRPRSPQRSVAVAEQPLRRGRQRAPTRPHRRARPRRPSRLNHPAEAPRRPALGAPREQSP